jgi:hypothetical protein
MRGVIVPRRTERRSGRRSNSLITPLAAVALLPSWLGLKPCLRQGFIFRVFYISNMKPHAISDDYRAKRIYLLFHFVI